MANVQFVLTTEGIKSYTSVINENIIDAVNIRLEVYVCYCIIIKKWYPSINSCFKFSLDSQIKCFYNRKKISYSKIEKMKKTVQNIWQSFIYSGTS